MRPFAEIRTSSREKPTGDVQAAMIARLRKSSRRPASLRSATVIPDSFGRRLPWGRADYLVDDAPFVWLIWKELVRRRFSAGY
jgi:hypothetical protein